MLISKLAVIALGRSGKSDGRNYPQLCADSLPPLVPLGSTFVRTHEARRAHKRNSRPARANRPAAGAWTDASALFPDLEARCAENTCLKTVSLPTKGVDLCAKFHPKEGHTRQRVAAEALAHSPPPLFFPCTWQGRFVRTPFALRTFATRFRSLCSSSCCVFIRRISRRQVHSQLFCCSR